MSSLERENRQKIYIYTIGEHIRTLHYGTMRLAVDDVKKRDSKKEKNGSFYGALRCDAISGKDTSTLK